MYVYLYVFFFILLLSKYHHNILIDGELYFFFHFIPQILFFPLSNLFCFIHICKGISKETIENIVNTLKSRYIAYPSLSLSLHNLFSFYIILFCLLKDIFYSAIIVISSSYFYYYDRAIDFLFKEFVLLLLLMTLLIVVLVGPCKHSVANWKLFYNRIKLLEICLLTYGNKNYLKLFVHLNGFYGKNGYFKFT